MNISVSPPPMNWLAHLYLSEPTAAFRIGNLLPDLVSAGSLAALPQVFRRGVERHRRIDAFTDAHPVVRRSMRRFPPPHRRFAGILTDVYYDHFLSRGWPSFCPVPLGEFVAEFFEGLEQHRAELPPEAWARLDHIRRAGWLCCYGELAGVSDVLRRMGARFRRPCDLASSMAVFEAQYGDFQADFAEFFPELRAEVG
jgi:acyl carrier protein phosphodiesterase